MKYKIPDTLAIIAVVLAIFVVLTWIVPSGQYERTVINEKTIVIPNSYHRVDQAPQGIGAFFLAPIKGFMQAGQIIVFVLFIGGAFGVLDATGAIEKGLKKIINASIKRPLIKKMFIPLMMVIFSVAGATFGLSEENLIFILLTIPIALSLGYDSIVGVAIPFVGSGVGFAGAITNPFTIGIAQGIAEVPIFSGWEYRIIVWLVMTSAAIAFVMWYAGKVAVKPTFSPVYEIDQAREFKVNSNDTPLGWAQLLVIIGFFTVIVLLIVGVNLWNWNIDEISALFLALAIFAALVTRLSTQHTIDSFLKGMKDMMAAALIIAFSKGILIVLTDGKIIDTILDSMIVLMNNMKPVYSVQIMFFIQSVINVFVPSGSGQAALCMPILSPLSDLLGISRQTAVLAFQLGDGLNNMVIPTSGVTMGVLSISKIPYGTWFKWILPLMLLLFSLAVLLLIPPTTLFFWGPR